MSDMHNYKIIFTGPSGAGKTTAIASISDIPPLTTEAKTTDTGTTWTESSTTTTAMDYGLVTLDATERLHLYGTPGQKRFDFMWEILSEGGIGVALLLNNNSAAPFEDLRFFLRTFDRQIEKTQLAIGITHTDFRPLPDIDDYHALLNDAGLNPPVFEVDARRRRDVALLVEALLCSLVPGVVA